MVSFSTWSIQSEVKKLEKQASEKSNFIKINLKLEEIKKIEEQREFNSKILNQTQNQLTKYTQQVKRNA